jgi:ubiquinol-cytochrome c reductase cytochrome b subunit
MDAKPSVGRRTWTWLDHRYKLGPLLEALLHVDIPISARTYYLGGITLFLFMVQAVTGILLAIYYQPTPDAAYKSILFIMNQVNFGWLIRSIHSWGANLMILFCVFHLLRVFFQAGYKAPREVTWVVGIVLLVVTLGFGFTGYLLPWDQRAYWATTVGSEIAGALPVVGQQLLILLRAGSEVTARTLSRFFGTHVLVLPLSLGGALLVHIALVHQQGLADPTRAVADPNEIVLKDAAPAGSGSKRLPFFPNYILDELIAWYVMLAVLIVLASLFPAGLEAAANPLQTPAHTKPEWYFLFLYQGLKLVPRLVGVTLPILGGLALVLLPFYDRNPYIAARRRPLAIGIATLTIVGIVAFTIWGWRS